eukprot:7390769-Prymnesium_polylepis.2
MGGLAPDVDLQDTVMPLATGNLALLFVKGVVPRTMCLLQLDINAFAIRWAFVSFLSLYTVMDVQLSSHSTPNRGSSGCQSKPSSRRSTLTSNICITFSDRGGVLRQLQLCMPGDSATAWMLGLKRLLETAPRTASSAHWRWVLACMAATSHRGATGCLLRSELRSLMVCANADLPSQTLEEAQRCIRRDEAHLQISPWLKPHPKSEGETAVGRQRSSLDARQVAGLLFHLCFASGEVASVFECFALESQMNLAQWLNFVRSKQLPHDDDGKEGEIQYDEWDIPDVSAILAEAKEQFARTPTSHGTELHTDAVFRVEQFASQLLNPCNTALGGAVRNAAIFVEPFAHYWTAASHNTCTLPGLEQWLLDSLNPITGLRIPARQTWSVISSLASAAPTCTAAYYCRYQLRTQLASLQYASLLGERVLVTHAGSPKVTHGHTFCTFGATWETVEPIAYVHRAPSPLMRHELCRTEAFDEVAKAVAECAFVASDLPVVISMEMHCSPIQQRR